MKKVLKKGISFLFLFSLVISTVSGFFCFNSVEVYAEEMNVDNIDKESGLPIVNEEIVRERILELCRAFEMPNVDLDNPISTKGKYYFTINGNAPCTHGTYRGNSKCTECQNYRILEEAEWLKNAYIDENRTTKIQLPNNPSEQLPGHFGSKKFSEKDYEWFYPKGYSCRGFANFVLWYICKENSDSKVLPNDTDKCREKTVIYEDHYSKEKYEEAQVSMGDVVEFMAMGHAAIFLAYSDDGMWVLDCNVKDVDGDPGDKTSHRIRIHEIKMTGDWAKKHVVTRATNYVPDYKYLNESVESNNSATEIYYHYTNGKGNYSYCGEKAHANIFARFLALFQKKSVFKEEMRFEESELTKNRSVSHENHWFSNICDIADCEIIEYLDENDIQWYRLEETAPISSTDTTISSDKKENDETDSEDIQDVLNESIENEKPAKEMGFVPWAEAGLEDYAIMWGDEVLENRMREKTGIYDREIMLSDVWEIEELDLTKYDWDSTDFITNISALGELTNLRRLELEGNNVSDISALSNLHNLTVLNLNYNDFYDYTKNGEPNYPTDYDPNTQFNWIGCDITPIYKLTNLEWLGLNGCCIDDFSGIRELKKLKHLELFKTNISDISVLGELTNLEYLKLGRNDISGMGELVNLPKLEYIELNNNMIIDFTIEQVQYDVFDYYEASGWTSGILKGSEDIVVFDLDTSYSSYLLYYFHICGTDGEGVAHYSYRADGWKLESIHFE